MRFLIGISLILGVFAIGANANYIISQEFIDHINSANSTWVAGRNFHPETSLNYFKTLMGVHPAHKRFLPARKVYELEGLEDIPDEFDPRQKWSTCPSIKEIRDQGGCGSCWAFGAVEAMSDRICIHRHQNIHVSAEDLLSCCYSCGFGCNGGFPGKAWDFWKKSGIVSGGVYGSKEGCIPYEIAPCEHHVNGTRGPCSEGGRTPKCHRECENNYKKSYSNDKTFGDRVYSVPPVEDQIKVRLIMHSFRVFH